MENKLLNSKKKTFGLYEAALATVLFIVFNCAALFFYRMVPASARGEGSFVYYVASFVIEALFAVTAYVVAVFRNIDFVKGIGADKKINGNIVFYSVLISFACLIFFGNITDVFVNFLGLCGYQSILGSLNIPNFGVYLIYVIISCLTPAIAEEILFRGAIATGLKEKGFKVALIGSAIIFTFMHGNPEQTMHQFIIGLIVGYIFLKTGNIWIGIVIHFINNFTAVTISYVFSALQNNQPATEVVEAAVEYGWGNWVLDLIIAIGFALVGYVVIMKLIRSVIVYHQAENDQKETKENATIKVDDAEVAVEMTVDGTGVEEVEQEEVVQEEKQEKKQIPMSVAVMFALAGVYFAFEWLSSLLLGLGII